MYQTITRKARRKIHIIQGDLWRHIMWLEEGGVPQLHGLRQIEDWVTIVENLLITVISASVSFA